MAVLIHNHIIRYVYCIHVTDYTILYEWIEWYVSFIISGTSKYSHIWYTRFDSVEIHTYVGDIVERCLSGTQCRLRGR